MGDGRFREPEPTALSRRDEPELAAREFEFSTSVHVERTRSGVLRDEFVWAITRPMAEVIAQTDSGRGHPEGSVAT